MINPIWDMNISLKEFKKVLKNPKDKNFRLFLTRVLAWVPFRLVFHGYITPQLFKKKFPLVRRQLDADLLGAGRLEFWDWLYKRMR